MSRYASIDEFRRRLGGVIFDEIYPGDDGAADAETDLAAAQAEIDGSLMRRYQIPVTGKTSSALVKDWTLTLAEERSYARTAGAVYAEKIKSRVELVRQYLAAIRNDTFSLPDARENIASSGSAGAVSIRSGSTPIFTREKMEGF